MSRRPTYSEFRWPMDSESVMQAQAWARGVSMQVLSWTWRSFDEFREKHLRQCNLEQPVEELERDLTSKHFVELNLLWARETGGYSSVTPHHEYPEMESRPVPPGRPPAYDLAFVSVENQRIAWPLEAKVVPSVRAMAKYLGDVEKFECGTASPLIGEGGMIGYLLAGAPAEFFLNLGRSVAQELGAIPEFADRPHRVSFHQRAPTPHLRLHHLVMDCTVSPSAPHIDSKFP